MDLLRRPTTPDRKDDVTSRRCRRQDRRGRPYLSWGFVDYL